MLTYNLPQWGNQNGKIWPIRHDSDFLLFRTFKSVVLTESVYAKFEPTFMKESTAVMADAINF